MQRDIENREVSPFTPEAVNPHEDRLQAIANDLGVDLSAKAVPSPAPIQTPTVRDQSAGAEPRRPASYEQALGQAEGTGKNPHSSAEGHFQFTDGTWLEYAPRVTDTSGMSKAQILALRHDLPTATAAERLFRADNGRYLRDHGLEDSPGNLSLAHFLGKGDAAKVLKADPATPIERLVHPRSLAANRSVLAGKSASEVIAWANKRIGATVDGPVARPDAVGDEFDYADVPPYSTAILTPDQVRTDAPLMQYKSGGDENGVTNKLADVTAWNPIRSSEILVWEPNEGGYIVVDGHQRTGLAKRLYPDDPSIRLHSIVLKEADGITAPQARVIGALRNIALGTGSLEDNARVLRDVPDAAELLKGAENKREIGGLANLNYEAFGAVLNNVIDPRIAAEIGIHAAHVPEAHMALVGLTKDLSRPSEAGAVVRQALADGFGAPQEHQFSLLGDQPQQALYVPIARILAAAEKRLRDEKRTFKVLSEKAGTIEDAGNVLDRSANESKVIGNDEALAILDRTAHSSGPVRDALIAAARAELSGARRADAVNQFLDALAGIDLRSAARGAAEHGEAGERVGAEGSGSTPTTPDDELAGSNVPLIDRAIAARDKAEPFSDPVGEAAKQQTALIEHDLLMDARTDSLKRTASWVIRNKETGEVVMETFDRKKVDALNTAKYEAVPIGEYLGSINGRERASLDLGAQTDPAIAERQRQEIELRAASPKRPGDIDAEGTMGLALFDVADQPTFRISDEGDAKPIHEIMQEAESDELAADALRNCLQPPKVTP
jgi:hypothetical protein